jgi:hypothetical protein
MSIRRRVAAMIVAVIVMASIPATGQQAGETLKVPVFGTVTVYRGQSPPRHVVLFISGDGGWDLGVVDMAQRLRDSGALVVGIDIRTFMKSLETSSSCAYPAGSLEELSRATRDMHRAILWLMEELEAVDWYAQRAEVCKDPELRAILEHNRDEEKEHAAMVLEWIRRRDPRFSKELKDYLFTTRPIRDSNEHD